MRTKSSYLSGSITDEMDCYFLGFSTAKKMSFTNLQRSSCHQGQSGFTLTEVITVIGIIGIMLAITFPAFQVVREAARRSTCSSNLRQVTMALHAYEATGRGFPAAADRDGASFMLQLLDHLDEPNLKNESRELIQAGSSDDQRFQILSDSRVEVLLCPSHFTEDIEPTLPFNGKFTKHYYGMAGPVHAAMGTDGSEYRYPTLAPKPEHGDISLAGIFGADQKGKFHSTEIRDIEDGTSNTIAIGEISGAAFEESYKSAVHRAGWAFGAEYDEAGIPSKCLSVKSLATSINQAGQPINTQAFNSNHTKGTYFGYADGSVHFVDERVKVDILKMYASISESEKLESLEDY